MKKSSCVEQNWSPQSLVGPSPSLCDHSDRPQIIESRIPFNEGRLFSNLPLRWRMTRRCVQLRCNIWIATLAVWAAMAVTPSTARSRTEFVIWKQASNAFVLATEGKKTVHALARIAVFIPLRAIDRVEFLMVGNKIELVTTLQPKRHWFRPYLKHVDEFLKGLLVLVNICTFNNILRQHKRRYRQGAVEFLKEC